MRWPHDERRGALHKPSGSIIRTRPGALGFNVGPLGLPLKPAALRRKGGTGRNPGLGPMCRLFQQPQQSVQRVLPVALLRAKTPGGDDDDAILGHPLTGEPGQARFEIIGQRGRPQGIEPQLHRGLDLVDVLPTGAGSPDEIKNDLLLGDRYGAGDAQHGQTVAEGRERSELHKLHDLRMFHDLYLMLKVPASEFQRNIGKYQDLALTQPVAVTRNGRVRTVLISAERYTALAGPPTKDEIAKRLAPHIERLKKEGVGALYLFGSVARDEAGPESDIDFFIDQTGEHFSLLDLFGVQHILEEILNWKIDVTTRDSLHLMLRSEIEDNAIRIF